MGAAFRSFGQGERAGSRASGGRSGYAVVDLETTGLFPAGHDRIVEIAIVALDADRRRVDEWATLVNPGRDVGPTRIHGITARQVVGAPSFKEIVGDVVERVADRVLVGHNVRFDIGFLETELSRAGHDVSWRPGLCTMALASRLGMPGRSLASCCESLGVDRGNAHTALDDARATASLLDAFMTFATQERLPLAIPEPIETGAGAWIQATGRMLRRDTRGPVQRSPLAVLTDQLPTIAPPEGIEPGAILAYMDLLDRVLEDRRLTEAEVSELFNLAGQWGLTHEAVQQIHRSYFDSLFALAMADGVLTPSEREDLAHVADLLGTGDPAALAVQTDVTHGGVDRRAEFRGLSVCFTGESVCTLNGDPMDRETQHALAEAAGLIIHDTVTKKLDILVLADPASQSGKARKAGQYGTRMIAERSFWSAVGVRVE
jgi:DNA polymerase-3 subunit epsilon